MSRRSNRLVLLDSEYRLQILQQLQITLICLQLVDLQHGVGNSDSRVIANDIIVTFKKLVTHSITSVWHRADAGFLAVSPQVTLVINPVVDCRYFPPGPRLLA